MLKATAVRSPWFVHVCLKSGSQLACQAPGALPEKDTIHRGGGGSCGGQSYGEGTKPQGDKQGTSGPGWLYRTTTRYLSQKDFAQWISDEKQQLDLPLDFGSAPGRPGPRGRSSLRSLSAFCAKRKWLCGTRWTWVQTLWSKSEPRFLEFWIQGVDVIRKSTD